MGLNKKSLQRIAVFLAINVLYEIFFPAAAWALTGGPSQPEVESFEPVGTTEMVDLFSGDFNYNIPLMDVGGYPINIAYHSGISMDQEASWVGLGWNINAGVIGRSMRGLPDDFNGDPVKKEMNMKEDNTWSLFVKPGIQIYGLSKLKKAEADREAGKKQNPDTNMAIPKASPDLVFNLGVTKNSYRGLGFFFGASFNIPNSSQLNVPRGIGKKKKDSGAAKPDPAPPTTAENKEKKSSFNLGFEANSQSGFSWDASYSQSIKNKDKEYNAQFGVGFNSRGGLKYFSYGLSKTKAKRNLFKMEKNKDKKMSRSYLKKEQQSSYSSGSLTFNEETYVPQHNVSSETGIKNFDATVGGELFGFHGNLSLGGTYSRQEIKNKNVSRNAYGYMYLQGADGNESAMLDFNREKEGTYNNAMHNLPLANLTYDVMSVSGQGTSGMFRPYRNNYGYVYDNESYQYSSNWANLGVEIGGGNAVHAGVSYSPTVNKSTTGPWTKDKGNELRDDYKFRGNSGDPLFEPVYFKAAGEKTPVNTSVYNALGADAPVRLTVKKPIWGMHFTLKKELESEYGTTVTTNIPTTNGLGRTPRNQAISYLTADKASIPGIGMEPQLKSYRVNEFSPADNNYESINRIGDSTAKAHHVAEVSVLNPDGMRYVYAIPAYNSRQEEVSFNVSGRPVDARNGQVAYVPGADNSSGNSRGTDNYFSKSKLPPYAHSYLLTAVLSPDYVDVTGDGVSDDDLGSAVKFNYTRSSVAYNWRTPYEQNRAQYNEGLRGNEGDDMGNYVYGEKEIWYLHSIVSKTHVAIFHTSLRKDGRGVKDDNGGLDTINDRNALRQLDQITLINKNDWLKHGEGSSVIKRVTFEYDHSLCKNIPNGKFTPADAGNNGKLTLKKIYFQHGNSARGSLSPYEFQYSSFNPDYSMADYDRWGGYKPNNPAFANKDNPYVEQGTAADNQVDIYASAWNLTRIQLPSGGTINVDYESDDYAFVQDKQAMNMLKVIGATNDPGRFNSNGPHAHQLFYDKGDEQNLYVVVDLPYAVNSNEEFFKKYVSGIKDLYFRFLLDIAGRQQYVSGYCAIENSGLINSTRAYIKLLAVKQGDPMFNANDEVNPIAKAGWQFGRMHLSKYVYPGSENNGSGVAAFKALVGSFAEAIDIFRGPYQRLKTKGIASSFVKGQSFIRLNNANRAKNGGGSRVKRLYMNDSWATMDPAAISADYGQVYDYSTYDEGLKQTISSGVATYEPSVGNDENPWRLPASYYANKHPLVPKVESYHEAPFGESFFPSPSVGYSKVTVRNLPKNGVKRTGTGRVEHEFWTARDYPVKASYTGIHADSKGNGLGYKIIASLLKVAKASASVVSQGYVVELNDMHGKPKCITTYSELDKPGARDIISRMSYKYRESSPGVLNNKVPVVGADGAITETEVGKEMDFVMDVRQNVSHETNGGIEMNGEFSMASIIPVIVVIPLPTFRYNRTVFQSAVATKVIQKYGIIDEVVAEDEGSVIRTKNLLYDKNTGEVLLTEVNNEYEDPVYNYTYPAHFAYDRMGQAYKNISYQGNITVGALGLAEVPGGIFVEGDELYVTGINQRAWVLKSEYNAGLNKYFITLINRAGDFINAGAYGVEIIRSGRRNLQGMSVGNVSMLANPAAGSSLVLNQQVVNSSANTFSDQWRKHTTKNYTTSMVCDTVWRLGLLGEIKRLLNGVFEAEDYLGYYLESNPYSVLDNQPWFASSNLYLNYLSSGASGLFLGRSGWGGGSDTYVTYCFNTTGSSPAGNVPFQVHMEAGAGIDCENPCENLSDIDSIISMTPLGFSSSVPHSTTSTYATVRKLDGSTCCIRISFSCTPCSYSAPAPASAPGNGEILQDGEAPGSADPENTVSNFSLPPSNPLCDSIAYYYLLCRGVITCGNYIVGEKYNPFVQGTRGIWRPHQAFAYVAERDYRYNRDTTFIRKDGTISGYNRFWIPDVASGLIKPDLNQKRWVASSTITNYTQEGQAVEVRDALGNYGAELYGRISRGVVAASSYAKLNEIANDNFEEYNEFSNECLKEPHWDFSLGNDVYNSSIGNNSREPGAPKQYSFLAKDTAHSGRRSLCTPPGVSRQVKRLVDLSRFQNVYSADGLFRHQYVQDYMPRFAPEPGKKYVVSAWVKGRSREINRVNNFDSAWVNVRIGGSTVVDLNFKASGPIIDGWQRIEGQFTVPATGADTIKVSLVNTAVFNAYFDDVRIHTAEGNMKAFVYDPFSLRLMAILDENNFATFYEYETDGSLVRVKKETEKGIVTLKESRKGLFKK